MSRWEKKKAIAIFTIVMLMSAMIQAQNGPPANVPAGGGGLFWKLSGNDNAGADHFIGTLNLSDLIAKTNGTERFRILGSSGYMGIGTANPLSLFHVSNGAVLFEGNTGSTPVSGGGTRLMWIPSKIAFRAGTVSASQWDNANIGLGSFAMGINAIASGLGSISLGTNTTASGQFSTAIGLGSQATGSFSLSAGSNTLADGNFSMALGNGSRSQGQFSIAIGESGTNSQGQFSYAQGSNAKAIGSFSHAWGSNVQALGDFSFAIGNNSTASANFSFATGNSVTSSGQFSFSSGNSSTASGQAAFATGNQVTAGGASSFATGSQVTTQGTNAFATGYQASANSSCSFAFGHSVTANESCAMVLGKGADNTNRLINNSPNSLMIGFNSDIPTLFVGSSQGTGTTGNVGIGTMTPGSKLTVNGIIESTEGGIKFPDGTIQATAVDMGSGATLDSLIVNEFIEVGSSIFITSKLNQIYTDYNVKIPGSDPYLFIQSNPDFDNHTIINAGNNGSVGIGTAKPGMGYAGTLKLDVRGHVRFGANDNDYVRLGFNGANAIIDNYGTGNLLINYYSNKDVHIGKIETGVPASNLFVSGTMGVGRTIDPNMQFVCKTATRNINFCSIAEHTSDYQYGIRSIVNRAKTKALAVSQGDENSSVENFIVYGDGRVFAREVKVTLITPFPDYVFSKDYRLLSIEELGQYIAKYNRLPGFPAAQEVASDGMNLGEIQAKQMEKIEELTLYILQLSKRLVKVEEENAEMKKIIKILEH